MQRAVDGDNIALGQHLFQIFDASASNLLLQLGFQWLVIEVEKFLAIESLQPSQDALSNAADGDCPNHLVLKIVLPFCDGRDIPISTCDLLVGGDEVADQHEDGHDNMFCDGDDV